MISNNALSMFLLNNHPNRLGGNNIRSIKYLICVSQPAVEKNKKVCKDFPNLVILTKSATPGEIQLKFDHSAVGNNSLGRSVVVFALTGDLSSPSVISLKI